MGITAIQVAMNTADLCYKIEILENNNAWKVSMKKFKYLN